MGASAGDDVLDDLANASQVGPGFTPPLSGPGDFTFWIQETGGDITYSLSFDVTTENTDTETVAVPALPWFMMIFLAAILAVFAVNKIRNN